MRINRNHPWLAGCKLFAFPDGTGKMKNLMGGVEGTVTNGPTLSRLGSHLALSYVQASSQYTVFGTAASYGLSGPDITIMLRAKPASYGSSSDIINAVATADNVSPSGFQLGFSNFGGDLQGWNLTLYGASFTANDGTSAPAPLVERVVGAAYRASVRSITMYLDGQFAKETVNTAIAWNVTGPNPIYVGQGGIGSFERPFDGNIGWVAIFDRALSDAEVFRFSRDWEWPFFDDDLGELYSTEISYTTVSGVQGFYTVVGVAGIVSYTTTLEALGAFGGDVIVDPAAPTVGSYVTVSGTREVYLGSAPTLVFYSNVSNTTSVYTVSTPVFYETVSHSRDRYVGLVDGRVDLIDTFRYRR